MFDLVTGKATHIPSRTGAPLVASTILQVAIVGAVLVPALLLTGALPEPRMMMAFVAAPPPPPPPPAAPDTAPRKPSSPTRPVPATQQPVAPVEPPQGVEPEPVHGDEEEGVPGGVEGGVPGGVLGSVIGGLPEAPPPPPPPAGREPVRVGGQIEQPTLIKRVDPIYPPIAVNAHVKGVVILEAIVDREGLVEQVRVLRSANSLLDKSAIDAVKQWQYSPVILNGKPERFILTVVLTFNLVTTS
jgi:protein TonB